jgi:hypothetical protein
MPLLQVRHTFTVATCLAPAVRGDQRAPLIFIGFAMM